MSKKMIAVVLGGFALLLAGFHAHAQSAYPNRPVRVVVGFPAGTSTDILARIYAQRLSEKLGQQFIVESRTGAASNVAAEAVSRADPDGYTLFMATAANAVGASAFKNLKFDILQDFEPIAVVSDAPNILVVNTTSGIASVDDLIKLAKSKSGEINYGSAGVGTVPHLSGEMFNMLTGIKLTHVPYRGNNQGIIDLISGRINAVFAPAPTVAGFLKDDRVKALATTSAKRTILAPDLPTLDEVGLKGFNTTIWYGLMAPKGTPTAILEMIAKVVMEANNDLTIHAQLKTSGAEPLSIGLEEFRSFLRADVEKWRKIVNFAGINLE